MSLFANFRTDVMEKLADNLFLDKVPERWLKIGFPSTRPLMSWYVIPSQLLLMIFVNVGFGLIYCKCLQGEQLESTTGSII